MSNAFNILVCNLINEKQEYYLLVYLQHFGVRSPHLQGKYEYSLFFFCHLMHFNFLKKTNLCLE